MYKRKQVDIEQYFYFHTFEKLRNKFYKVGKEGGENNSFSGSHQIF